MNAELLFYAPAFGQSGYEMITRGMLIALDKLGVKVGLIPAWDWNLEKIQLGQEYQWRLDRMLKYKVQKGTPCIMHQKYHPKVVEQLAPQTKLYCYTLFETDRCPKNWDFSKFEKIYVFSEWNKKTWLENGFVWPKRLDTLPFGIQKDLFCPQGGNMTVLNASGYKFITSGDFTERKNFEALIEAYTTEFKRNEDVCLIMKVHYGGFTQKHKLMLINKIKELSFKWNSNPPRILFFGDKIKTEDLPLFYRGGDCFVLPSQGEGLGMCVQEAMACGLPVITTGWSAMTDYIKDGENGLFIDNKLETIDDIGFISKCPNALNHKWAVVSIDSLKQKMRWTFENKEEAKKIGENASKSMENRSWHKSAVKLVNDIL